MFVCPSHRPCRHPPARVHVPRVAWYVSGKGRRLRRLAPRLLRTSTRAWHETGLQTTKGTAARETQGRLLVPFLTS